jgi:PAS domain S-box-containing protein
VGSRLAPDAHRTLDIREAQLRQALALGNLGAWEWDVANDVVTWSPELRRILGVGDEVEARAATFIDMIHPEDRPWAEQSMAESLRTGVAPETPFRIIRPDGQVRVLRGPAMTCCHGEDGRPVFMVGVLQDVTGTARESEFLHDHALFETMSGREKQVLAMVARGGTSKAIAQELGLSPKTVETYRSRIMGKLGIPDIAGLVRFCIRHGLTAP